MGFPLTERAQEPDDDARLVAGAVDGSREDLERLILRHQSWIYNIALRMVLDVDDAKDVTQEILIKVLTKLGTYDASKAAFRTWLYRIVANHVINLKKREYRHSAVSFDDYFQAVPDKDPGNDPEAQALVEEVRVSCHIGALLCFGPRDRLVFILGAILDVPDTVGSEVLEISPANYRQILSRSRKKLFETMRGYCEWVDSGNPCRCQKWIPELRRLGVLDPEKTVYSSSPSGSLRQMLGSDIDELESFCEDKLEEFSNRFREHPFYESDELRSWLFQAIEQGEALRLSPS